MKNDKKDIEKGLSLLSKSFIIFFIGITFSKVLSYFYRIVIARYYGAEVYGLFSIALMVLGIGLAISLFGLSEGVVKFLATLRARKETHKIRFLFQRTFAILVLSGIFFGIIMFFLSETISINIFHNEGLIPFLRFFALALPIWVLASLFLSAMKGFEKVKAYSLIFNILQNLVKFVVLIALIYLGFNSDSVIFSFIAGLAAMLLFAFFYCRRYLSKDLFGSYSLSKDKKKHLYNRFASYSLPLMFTWMIGNLFYWTDTLALGYLTNATMVGLYSAAVPIALLLFFVPETFTPLFLPMISRGLAQKKFQVVKEISKQVNKWIFALNLPLFFLFIIFADNVMLLLFGQAYLPAQTALKFLAVGYFFASLSLIPENILLASGRSKVILSNWIVFATFNLILNFLLIPPYGLLGAALATAISWAILTTVLLVESLVLVKVIPIRRKMISVLIASIIPLLIVYPMRHMTSSMALNVVIVSLIYFVIYVALLITTRSFDTNDWEIIKKIKNKFSRSS